MRHGDEIDSAFSVVWGHLVPEDALRPADAIFCFGSRHWRVPERAADLVAAGLAPLVLISGGTVESDGRREADRMAADLVRLGVPGDALVLERAALNTAENVRLGVPALEAALGTQVARLDAGRPGIARPAAARPVPISRMLLVSWPLATQRCRATMSRLHPDIDLVSVPAIAASGHRWPPTPKRVRLALGELDRLDRYGRADHLVPVRCPAEVDEAAALLRRWVRTVTSPAHAALDVVEPSQTGREPEQVAFGIAER